MVSSHDLMLRDGRTLRFYDSLFPDDDPGGSAAGAQGRRHGSAPALTLMWHHGSPQTGAPLAPLLSAAAARGIRLLSYGRPSYGGSSPRPGRDVASAAADVAHIADALGIERFAVMGASGGGPHALACAALLPGRVTGAVSFAGPAPLADHGDAWYRGMASDGSLRAAVAGRAARELYAETDEFDPESFIPADYAALEGDWTSLTEDVAVASAAGPEGVIDDDLALAGSWGFEPADVDAPVLLVHGGRDRVIPPAHSDWLLAECPRAELWSRPDDGHISVLAAVAPAMDWLLAHA